MRFRLLFIDEIDVVLFFYFSALAAGERHARLGRHGGARAMSSIKRSKRWRGKRCQERKEE